MVVKRANVLEDKLINDGRQASMEWTRPNSDNKPYREQSFKQHTDIRRRDERNLMADFWCTTLPLHNDS